MLLSYPLGLEMITRRVLRGTFLLLLICWAGCAVGEDAIESPEQSAAEATSEEVSEEIRNPLRRLLMALNRADAEAILAECAEDILILPPGAAAIGGGEPLRGQLESIFSEYRLLISFSTTRASMGGELSYIMGRYSLAAIPHVSNSGEPSAESGNALLVLRKEGSPSQWKFSRLIWNRPPESAQ